MNSEELWLYISKILHPINISPFLGLLYLFLADFTAFESLKWVGVSAAVTIAPINLHMTYSSRFDNFNAVREKRQKLYALGAAELVLLAIVFQLMKAPELINTPVYSLILLLFVGWAINTYYTKISIHTGIISGFASATAFLNPVIGLLLGLLTVVVGFSRIRLDAHTPKQVLLGAMVPAPVVAATYILLL